MSSHPWLSSKSVEDMTASRWAPYFDSYASYYPGLGRTPTGFLATIPFSDSIRERHFSACHLQRRRHATRESTTALRCWFQDHIKNPYPTKQDKVILARATNMTFTQVSTWFANARRRLKKKPQNGVSGSSPSGRHADHVATRSDSDSDPGSQEDFKDDNELQGNVEYCSDDPSASGYDDQVVCHQTSDGEARAARGMVANNKIWSVASLL